MFEPVTEEKLYEIEDAYRERANTQLGRDVMALCSTVRALWEDKARNRKLLQSAHDEVQGAQNAVLKLTQTRAQALDDRIAGLLRQRGELALDIAGRRAASVLEPIENFLAYGRGFLMTLGSARQGAPWAGDS